MTESLNTPEGTETGAGGVETNSAGRENEPIEQQQPKEWKIEDLPAEAQAAYRKAVAAAEAKARTTSKQNAADEARNAVLAEFAEKLGLKPSEGEKPDPQALADQLAAAQSAAVNATRERDLIRAANRAGADADALADSNAFLAKLHKLDPAAETYVADLDALVKEAVDANPKRYRTGGALQPAATGAGADFGHGSGSGPKAPENMDVEEMRELLKRSR